MIPQFIPVNTAVEYSEYLKALLAEASKIESEAISRNDDSIATDLFNGSQAHGVTRFSHDAGVNEVDPSTGVRRETTTHDAKDVDHP